MKPMIKRILCLALPVVMVMTMLTGCPPTRVKEFSCGELIEFYEEKGYSVTHTEYPEPEDGCNCTVEIQEEDGKYIRFRFYDSPVKAEDYADTRSGHWLVRLFCSMLDIRTVDYHWQAAYEYNSQTLYDLFDQFTDMPYYIRDSFFSQEHLESLHLADIPVPKLENSRLIAYHKDIEWFYYGNLTREEFDAYVLSVVDYLKAREDIYYPCYYYEHRLELGISPVDDYTNFGETYDPAKDQHRFAFSMEQERNGTDLIDPIMIEIVWEEADWGEMGFTSNTTIRFYGNYYRVSYELCAAQHTYDEGRVYPVPGWERGITIYQCIHCGDRTQSEYLDSNYKSYAVNVTEGVSYILSNNWNVDKAWDIDSLHAGGTLEITVRRAPTGSTTMMVNGESLPVLWEDENTQTFGFIMPESDVTIEIFPAETE